MEKIKNIIIYVASAFSAAIAGLFGGWNAAIITLCVFMACDYFSGLICAGVFHKSLKTNNGALESKAGFKGLLKKALILLVVFLAAQLDRLLGFQYIKDMCCFAYIFNEAISIIENLALMGVPVPNVIKKALEVVKEKGGENEKETTKNDKQQSC